MEEKHTQLIKKSNTYKMIIPQNVEKKIRYLCQEIPDVEWSGILFVDYKGSFENNDLVITCRDICLMDVGTSCYTEFDMSPDIVSYICEHPELIDCKQSLIHSHNRLKTFMSYTDTQTLLKEGSDRNCFVSLIVNNEGSYTAAVTRKIESTKSITDCYKYSLFGEKSIEKCDTYQTQDVVVEYYMLDIEKEEAFNFQDLKTRMEELKSNKRALPNLSNTLINEIHEGIDYKTVDFEKCFKNHKEVQKAVMKLITGEMDGIHRIEHLDEYLKEMNYIFPKKFKTVEDFKLWMDSSICDLIYGTDVNATAEYIEKEGLPFVANEVFAYHIREALKKLPIQNEYIKMYIEELDLYY